MQDVVRPLLVIYIQGLESAVFIVPGCLGLTSLKCLVLKEPLTAIALCFLAVMVLWHVVCGVTDGGCTRRVVLPCVVGQSATFTC